MPHISSSVVTCVFIFLQINTIVLSIPRGAFKYYRCDCPHKQLLHGARHIGGEATSSDGESKTGLTQNLYTAIVLFS
ncbi:hypothetical protein B0H11DRAFT_2101357 [Mycena galericulata]|nr:hypothetical protein B0H11DRAFT_2101357 [Mycena galericulata]